MRPAQRHSMAFSDASATFPKLSGSRSPGILSQAVKCYRHSPRAVVTEGIPLAVETRACHQITHYDQASRFVQGETRAKFHGECAQRHHDAKQHLESLDFGQ